MVYMYAVGQTEAGVSRSNTYTSLVVVKLKEEDVFTYILIQSLPTTTPVIHDIFISVHNTVFAAPTSSPCLSLSQSRHPVILIATVGKKGLVEANECVI